MRDAEVLLASGKRAPVFSPISLLDRSYTTALRPGDTFTRATVRNYFDNTGTLQTAAINVPAFDCNPADGALRGLVIEPVRTNMIRNNTMVGAVAGIPGTRPTTWAAFTLAGLTQEIIGTGVENGIEYVELKFSGTTSSASLVVNLEAVTQVAAAPDQVWCPSGFVRHMAPPVGLQYFSFTIQQNNSGGSQIATPTGTRFQPGTGPLSQNRFIDSKVLDQATVVTVQPQLRIVLESPAAASVQFRLGLPTLEQAIRAGSPIRTSTVPVTLGADMLTLGGIPQDGNYIVEAIGGTLNQLGTKYQGQAIVAGGVWPFVWPAAAIAAGERHLQRVRLWRISG